ncbi:MAG: riboflavin synthase [Planctomycetota bacterium]
MFTGIIETTGRVTGIAPGGGGALLRVDAGPVAADAKPGASIAVNGVCLTVRHLDGPHLSFDVIQETLRRTTLGRLQVGDRVNLERSLMMGDRLDGHFVQGHVDGQARLVRRVATGAEHMLWFEAAAELMPCVVPKGSIAVDGVSLTIAEVSGHQFSVALTPTSLDRTTLGERREGEWVNLETDILVRTIVHTLAHRRETGGLTLEQLREQGFL